MSDNKIIPSGIIRHGPLCYLISAIQSLRYLDINKFDKKYVHIIEKIREGNLNYILNYFNFPIETSSARDAIIQICNKCGIEIIEYFEGFEFESKNLIIVNYYDNLLNNINYSDSCQLMEFLIIKNRIYCLKSATFYSPKMHHYIAVIFKNNSIYVLNDDKVEEISTNKLTTKISYYGDEYYCECAIYE